MPRNVPTGTGGDEAENTSSFAYKAIPERINAKRDSNELAAQAEDLSLTQQKERATEEEAFKPQTENGGWKVKSEEQMILKSGGDLSTSFPQFEGDVECGPSEQLRDEEESGPAGDDETRSERGIESSGLSDRSSPARQSNIDETQKGLMERFLKASSYTEIEAMLNDPAFADGPTIGVKDRNNVYRRLGGEAAAIREQQGKTLCDLCKGMSVETLLRQGGYPHAKDYATLEDSAKHCPLCYLLSYLTISLTADDTVEDRQITVHIGYGALTGYVKDECPYMMVSIPEHGDGVMSLTLAPLNTEIGTFLR